VRLLKYPLIGGSRCFRCSPEPELRVILVHINQRVGKNTLAANTEAAGMVRVDVGQQDGVDLLRLIFCGAKIRDEPAA
jgi:hypothetical protein